MSLRKPPVQGDHGDVERIPSAPSARPAKLFNEINALRKSSQDVDSEDAEAAERAKYTDTIFGQIAGSKVFELTTMSLISLNAVAIGYDVDYTAKWGKPDSLYDGPVGFIFVEWFFAIYFSLEVTIRFIAYKSKIQCLFDPWFVFDSVLVTMMVFETWILPFIGSGGPFAQLSILRLLRLLRITRMARLMRAVPEILVIIKGMVAATRTVACTGVLLLLVLYTFCILFTNEYHQGKASDSYVSSDGEQAEVFFGSMGKSMFTLFIMGTVLDDVTQATNAIRDSQNTWMLLTFIVFILISSFMMLNMLIGVLVEVVGATAEGEREKQMEDNIQEAMGHIFDRMDKDANREISRKEFMAMKQHGQVMQALSDLDINSTHFSQYAEILFRPQQVGDPPASLSYDAMVKMILRLRPGAFVSALDFAVFAKTIGSIQDRMKDRVMKVERLCLEIAEDTAESASPRISGVSSDQASTSIERINSKEAYEVWVADSRLPGFADHSGQNRIVNGPPSYLKLLRSHDVERLEKTASTDIIEELQRRLGMPDLEKSGMPWAMLDEELQNRLKAANSQGAEAFASFGVPVDEDTETVYA